MVVRLVVRFGLRLGERLEYGFGRDANLSGDLANGKAIATT